MAVFRAPAQVLAEVVHLWVFLFTVSVWPGKLSRPGGRTPRRRVL